MITLKKRIADNIKKKLENRIVQKGSKRERQNKFNQTCKIMYIYLCYYIGSERKVKLRRCFLRKKFLKLCCSGVTLEVSGSKAEGLDMKGSDLDLMMLNDHDGDAYENTVVPTPNEGPCRLQYKSSNVSPGYVLVERLIDGKFTSLSKSVFKNEFIQSGRVTLHCIDYKPHGPSLMRSTFGEETDLVFTIRSKTWPEITNEWIVRERKFGWPSKEMINHIAKQRCCIVPVGSKQSRASDWEWRLSFSLAEKDLIFSFNHTQLLVYGFLKLVLKEIFNIRKDISQLLCSYFLKTAIFWVIEETNASVWRPHLIILCFHLCLERLIHFIAEENCPNYFIRINNMFASKFRTCEKDKLLRILCDISENGLRCIVESETMNQLKYFIEEPSKLLNLKQLQKRKYLMEITGYIFDLIIWSKRMSMVSFGIRHSQLPLLRSLFKVPFIRESLRTEVCHYIDSHRIRNDNNKVNSLQKLHLFLLCAGCKTDLAAGKLTLASWKTGKYVESLAFADLALKFCKYRLFHAGFHKMTELSQHFNLNFECETEVDLIQTFYRFSTTDVLFLWNSCLFPSEITCFWSAFGINWKPFSTYNLILLAFLPEHYGHFLRFLFMYKLGQTLQSDAALTEMQRFEPKGSEFERCWHLLGRIYLQIVGNRIKNRTENEREKYTNFRYELMEQIFANNICLSELFEKSGIDLSMAQSCTFM